jgi:NTE family protein
MRRDTHCIRPAVRLIVSALVASTLASISLGQTKRAPTQQIPLQPTQALHMKRRPTIGVAFEGGGALGLAHIGVIEWLEAHHIPVDYISGTSMGGLVGGLYATGKSPAEIRALIKSIDWDEVLRGQLPFEDLAFRRKEDRLEYPNTIELGLKRGLGFPGGLNSGQQVQYILDRVALPYSNVASFDDLPIPFRCVGTEMSSGTAHVFKDGSLSVALRSTMSLPAIFNPVTTAEGKVYVDGGLLNNLPVDVVKNMGADIVIAVYLATAPFDAKTPQSAFSILGNSMAVMIAANERRNMEAADILLTVNLDGYTGSDYKAADKIANLGVEGAEKKARMLATLSVDDNAWSEYLTQRNARKIITSPAIQFVEVRGTSDRTKHDLEHDFQKYLGAEVDPTQLEKHINRLVGEGRFSSVTYELTQRDGKEGLLVDVEEKSYAPPTLVPGLFMNGNDYANVQTTIAARITAMDIGGFRSELRTDVSLLSTYGIRTEYYHPFTPDSRWFIAPSVSVSNSPLDLYKNDQQIAEYRIKQYGGGLDFGYEINRKSEIRAGYNTFYRTANVRLGTPDIVVQGGRLGTASLRYAYIGVDDPVIPRSGNFLTTSFGYTDTAPGATKGGFPVAELRWHGFKRVSKPGSVFLSAQGGTTFGHNDTGLPPFFLGGGFRLGAFGTNEVITNQYFLFQAGYLHQIGRLSPFFGGKIYTLGFYEVAKPYYGLTPTALPQDANGGVVINTFLGPLFLGGAAGNSGNHKLYFEIGRIFN